MKLSSYFWLMILATILFFNIAIENFPAEEGKDYTFIAVGNVAAFVAACLIYGKWRRLQFYFQVPLVIALTSFFIALYLSVDEVLMTSSQAGIEASKSFALTFGGYLVVFFMSYIFFPTKMFIVTLGLTLVNWYANRISLRSNVSP